MRTCPVCHEDYKGSPAKSRIDGLPICPKCGLQEALFAAGIAPDERERIARMITQSEKRYV